MYVELISNISKDDAWYFRPSSGTSRRYVIRVLDKSRMTKAYLSINLELRVLYYARYNANSNERARDCVWRSTRRYHCRRLWESDVDRFVVVPLGRIDCAVMGCFITIMAAHFPDERSEFGCGYMGYDWQCSKTGIDAISHATLEKCVSILSTFFTRRIL